MVPPLPDSRRGQKRWYPDRGYDLDFPPLSARNRLAPMAVQPSSSIIIKLIDDRPKFRDMKIAERDAFSTALFEVLGGPPQDSHLLRGGDLVVKPRDAAQQNSLLNLNNCQVANRLISCSFPRSQSSFQDVIRGVPVADSEKDFDSERSTSRPGSH